MVLKIISSKRLVNFLDLKWKTKIWIVKICCYSVIT